MRLVLPWHVISSVTWDHPVYYRNTMATDTMTKDTMAKDSMSEDSMTKDTMNREIQWL